MITKGGDKLCSAILKRNGCLEKEYDNSKAFQSLNELLIESLENVFIFGELKSFTTGNFAIVPGW